MKMTIGLSVPEFRDDYASKHRDWNRQNMGAGQRTVTDGGGVALDAPVRSIIVFEDNSVGRSRGRGKK